MSDVDAAIERAEARNRRAILAATGADAMDAWDDCALLAEEVVRLRAAIPPQVTTVEELEALPDRALLVNMRTGRSWRRQGDCWGDGSRWVKPEGFVDGSLGPLTVVWAP